MTVLGFDFSSIKATSEGKVPRNDISISSTPKIESVEKKDLSDVGIDEAVVVKFSFVTKYDPDIGEIVLTGELLYQVDDAKKIAKQFKDGSKLDEKMALDILNTIFRRCLVKVVDISDTLRLPPPIRFPIVTTEKPTAKN